MKEKFTESTTETVIYFKTDYSRGELILDTNFYTKNYKRISKRLKGCIITNMFVRKKENINEA